MKHLIVPSLFAALFGLLATEPAHAQSPSGVLYPASNVRISYAPAGPGGSPSLSSPPRVVIEMTARGDVVYGTMTATTYNRQASTVGYAGPQGATLTSTAHDVPAPAPNYGTGWRAVPVYTRAGVFRFWRRESVNSATTAYYYDH